jgi:hypothetical protein
MTIPVEDAVQIEEPDYTDEEVFNSEVGRVYELIRNDESGETRDKVLAEIHVFLATLDQVVRKMMVGSGPMGMLANMMGAKKDSG